MNATTLSIIGAATGLIGAIIGAIGLLIAIRANSISEHANRLSETANKTARESLNTAVEANRIAKESNELAEDANSISDRALAATTDNLIYDWDIQLDDKSSTATIRNNSPHIATEVSIIVKHQNGPVARSTHNHVPDFSEITLNLESTFQQHFDKVRQNPSTRPFSSNGIFFAGRKGKTIKTILDFHITWKTPTAVHRDSVIQKTLSHGDNYGTIETR